MVFPYINMNPLWVYMCSPSWTPLPPPSPYHPSASSQCTSPKHPVLFIEPGLAIRFIYDIGNKNFSSLESFGYCNQDSDFKGRVSNWHKLGSGPNLGKDTSSLMVATSREGDLGMRLSKNNPNGWAAGEKNLVCNFSSFFRIWRLRKMWWRLWSESAYWDWSLHEND